MKRRGRRGPRSSRAGRSGEPPGRSAGRARGPRREPAEVPRRAGHPREGRRFRRNDHHRAAARSLEFVNDDPGIQHNVEIKDGGRACSRARSPASRPWSTTSARRGDVRLRLLGPPEYDRVRDDPVGSSPKGLRHAASTDPPRPGHRHDHVGVWWSSDRRRTAMAEIGVMAPPIVGTTLDGTTFDLASYRGRPVIVNFWGPSCIPVDEFPAVPHQARRARGRWPGDRRRPDRRPTGARPPFVAEYGASWPTVIDPGESIKRAYRVVARPHTWFVDRAGVLRSLQIGGPMTTPGRHARIR